MDNQLEQPKVALCDSCNMEKELFDVPHHQPGNEHIWHYCDTCKTAHEKNKADQQFLEELMTTHPDQANDPQTLKLFHENDNDIEKVKRHLDQSRQPALEAEVVT